VLVVEQNFAEFFGKFTHDNFGKHHEPSARAGSHGEAALEGSGTVSGAHPRPKTKVSPQLKAMIGLMKIEAVEFTMRSSVRSPT
jgi:hypothetical protein